MKQIFPEAEHGIIYRNLKTQFNYSGWPTVCMNEKGVLYTVASALRMQHGDPSGKNCMFVSFNEGKTWTPPIVVNDDWLDDRDSGIVAIPGGKMCINFFTRYDDELYQGYKNFTWCNEPDKQLIVAWGNVLPLIPNCRDEEGSFVILSDDYGVTWSEKIPVPLTSPHGASLMKNGELVYLGKFTEGENKGRIGCIKSRDNGRTWEISGVVPEVDGTDTNYHFHEPHAIELKNGRILGSIRAHDLPSDKFDVLNTVFTTYSDDGGVTWSTPKPTGMEGLPPHLMQHSSGAVLCSFGHRGGEGDSSERVAVSYDNGDTWTDEYIIYPDAVHYDLGYPSTVELPDGSLLTVYYQFYEADDGCASIMQTKWRLEK